MNNTILDKSFNFTVRVVKMYRVLRKRRTERPILDQVLRSGTSIGANVREANSAQSKPDFISKMGIALKECDETGYWLELLKQTEGLSGDEYCSLEADRGELFALLTAILKSARSR